MPAGSVRPSRTIAQPMKSNTVLVSGDNFHVAGGSATSAPVTGPSGTGPVGDAVGLDVGAARIIR